MSTISLILFDLNGVLYRYDRDARIAHLGAITGLSPDAVRAAIWDSGFENAGDAGSLDADAYLTGFAASLGYPLTEADWLDAQRAALRPIEASLALLPRIRPNVACAVLTNNNRLVSRHFATLYPQVAAAVLGRTYVSAEFAARKPDPAVFSRCLRRLGVPPAAALFVDDSAANIAGAEAAGLHGHRYTTPGNLQTALIKAGLLVDPDDLPRMTCPE